MSAAPGRLLGALLGATAGLLSGMLGIGGGLVVTPVLALRGLPLRKATGTALGAVFVCAAVAVVAEALTEPGQLVVPVAVLIVVGAQFGVVVGRKLLNAMPDGVLRLVFLMFLLFAAARNLGLLGLGADAGFGVADGEVFGASSLGVAAMIAGIGLLAGTSTVLFGIGGGVVVVPLLTLCGTGFHEAAAVSLLAMIPTALTGLWIAKRDGRLEAGLLKTLLPAAAVGAAAGVWLRNRALEAEVLETVFGVFLLYAALRLWMTRPRAAEAGGA